VIHRITLKNFKSLCDVSVELKPLTIIIGANASGKSNLLDALEAIKRLVEDKGTMTSSQEGEQASILVDEVLWRKAYLG
jgi:AAA15 family ATPase/GTPase